MIKPLGKVASILLVIAQTILPIITNESAASSAITIATQSNILENHEKTEKKYGGMKGQGVSVVLGKQAKEDILKVKTDINSPSTVGSTAGDASIISGGDVNIKGSQVITKGDSTIQGQNVAIEAAQDTQQSIQTHQWSQVGLRVKVESPIIEAAQKISDSYKRAKESDDSRLKALYAIKGGQQAYDTYNQYSNSQNNGGSGAGSAIQVKIGYSNTRQRSETITQSNTTVSSDINAQGNVTIKATGDPNANKGDLAVVGSNIQGKNVSLEAARDIALQSSADTFDSASRNSSSHFSAGVVIGSSGVGVYAEGARGRGKENEDSVTHKETTVTATDTLTINSGQDTNLKGAIAKGETIKADVGGNLNIESEQDTSTYKARQQNMSGSAQVTYGGGGNASASYMQSKTDADYKSVQEQSGLFAGTGGYDINVAKNTDLKGAVIASDTSADKNTLTTDTLTYSDISNRSKYSASSFGGSISASWSGGGNNGSGGNTGTSSAGSGARSIGISGAPMLGMPSSDSVSGTTRSAVAPGTINTTSNIASLSRDTKNANGSVKNIFDKKKVATNQEVAQVFSEVAYHAVGDIAKSQTKPYEDAKLRYEVAAEQAKAAKQSGDTEKQQQAEAAMSAAQNDMAANQSAYDTWKDGSPAKIALHTLVGTLAAAMGKGDIAGGALGAGVSEALSNVTNQLPKALQPLASAIIGAAVSQATGGNPMSGGSTALAGDLYNRTPHKGELDKIKELANGDKDKEKRLLIASCALIKCSAEFPEGTPQYEVTKSAEDLGNSPEYAAELAQLKRVKSESGPGGLFSYTFAERAWDALKLAENKTQFFTRTGGWLQAISGGVIAYGGALTGPAWPLAAGYGTDQFYAGVRTGLQGQQQPTVGGQVAQYVFGVSPEMGEMLNSALGLAGAYKMALGRTINAGSAEIGANSAVEAQRAFASRSDYRYARTDVINKEFTQPAYKPGELAVEFKTNSVETGYVRVYAEGKTKMEGRWFMRAEDIAGLTPAQIKERWALEYEPTHKVDVTVPADFRLRVGEAGANDWGSGGRIQYQALDEYKGPNPIEFTNSRRLK